MVSVLVSMMLRLVNKIYFVYGFDFSLVAL